jgi:hypothetical protein
VSGLIAHSACRRVIGDGCNENTKNDRDGSPKASGEQQCEQLRLVAYFTYGNNQHGNEERFHGPSSGVLAEINGT